MSLAHSTGELSVLDLSLDIFMPHPHAPEPTVLVVEDDPAMCNALSRLIKAAGLQVETFANAQSFLDACPPPRPGCLILDVRLPGMSGLELQKNLVERGTHLPVIVITGHGDIPMAIRAMKAGALDFFEKPFNSQALLERVRQALALNSQAYRQHIQLEAIAARMALLSPREKEVLERVVAGKLNKEIAQELDISISTVEAHRKRIMEKLQAQSLSGLVRMWICYRRHQ